ncbi:MAG: hypothetical protein ABI432_04540, partial [Flavobacteriales bacterium]
ILFTNGDNDTFPLRFVQMTKGFRTDVTVVNMSQFNLPRQIAYWRYRTAHPLPLTLADSVYERELTDVALLRKEPLASIAVDTFLQGVEQKKLSKDIYWTPLLDLPSQTFTLPVVGGDTLIWTISKSHLTRSGIALLDMLRSNQWKRPFHFVITMFPATALDLTEYFSLEGLAYHLMPSKPPKDSADFNGIEEDRCLTLFLNDFDWSGMENATETKAMMNTNYRLQMAAVAKRLCTHHRYQDAERLLDQCMRVIPQEGFPMERMGIPIMDAYYASGAEEKADQVALLVVEQTLAMDLSQRDWGSAQETEPIDLKERVLERVMNTLKEKKRREALKRVKQMARTAGLG